MELPAESPRQLVHYTSRTAAGAAPAARGDGTPRRFPAPFALILPLLLLAGCARPALYSWGDYPLALEQRYEKSNPAGVEKLLREQLPEFGTDRPVPPGLFADYGFLLYRRGELAGAAIFFEKERSTFPESAFLMNSLIERIKEQIARESFSVSAATGGDSP